MEQELVLAWLSLHRCLLSRYWAGGHRGLSPEEQQSCASIAARVAGWQMLWLLAGGMLDMGGGPC